MPGEAQQAPCGSFHQDTPCREGRLCDQAWRSVEGAGPAPWTGTALWGRTRAEHAGECRPALPLHLCQARLPCLVHQMGRGAAVPLTSAQEPMSPPACSADSCVGSGESRITPWGSQQNVTGHSPQPEVLPVPVKWEKHTEG